ncbi:hypothetical protein MJO28_001698 [Puccinia striiformis f. sp. tritici]|uniref:Uncharacterized protein n=1 Tax=Puccinia striiformis f. sp. tritici TaxID=168172 RepID=A0ACC0EVY6_9BASI|nr:hypothetical protein MJO28_001698 [Puccinia striiformis f. sp. tritici]
MKSFTLLGICVLFSIQSQAVYSAFECTDPSKPTMKLGFCGRKLYPDDPQNHFGAEYISFLAIEQSNGDFTCRGVTTGAHPVEGRWCCNFDPDPPWLIEPLKCFPSTTANYFLTPMA